MHVPFSTLLRRRAHVVLGRRPPNLPCPNASKRRDQRFFCSRQLPLRLRRCQPFALSPGLRSRGSDLQRRSSWTQWSITIMINFNETSDFFDFSSYYQGDEPALDSTGGAPPPSTPPSLPPDSPLPHSPPSTLSDCAASSSPVLTDEEDAHYNNLIYHAVDSPVLPPSPQPHMADLSMAFVPSPPPFALSPTITDNSLPSPVSAVPSPRTSFAVSVSPPVLKRPRSLSLESSEPQAGPSSPSPPAEMPSPEPNPRPAKRARPSVPGEMVFELDVQVPAFASSAPAGPPMGRTRQRVDYSACKCANRTGKPARHWKTACPYNPARHTNRVSCELCGLTFSRHDNMDRHMEDYH